MNVAGVVHNISAWDQVHVAVMPNPLGWNPVHVRSVVVHRCRRVEAGAKERLLHDHLDMTMVVAVIVVIVIMVVKMIFVWMTGFGCFAGGNCNDCKYNGDQTDFW